jgi:hypothetical protein
MLYLLAKRSIKVSSFQPPIGKKGPEILIFPALPLPSITQFPGLQKCRHKNNHHQGTDGQPKGG